MDISIELEQSSILITALRTFTSEIDVKLTLDNATTMYLILTQSSPSNNVVVNGQSYSGNLYSISATITSYTIVGQTSTYLPGVQYSFSGGGIQINSDGSYSVNSTVPITFQILYSGGTITLEVKASPPKSIYITIPSYSLTMGSNIISVKVAGTFLSQGISYSNTSGEFTWNNNILQILGYYSKFHTNFSTGRRFKPSSTKCHRLSIERIEHRKHSTNPNSPIGIYSPKFYYNKKPSNRL